MSPFAGGSTRKGRRNTDIEDAVDSEGEKDGEEMNLGTIAVSLYSYMFLSLLRFGLISRTYFADWRGWFCELNIYLSYALVMFLLIVYESI